MSWGDSLDRVLWLREQHRQDLRIRELLKIITEMEERFQVVVNRDLPALKDVPTWKDRAKKGRVRFRRGTFREYRARAEWNMSAETRKQQRRVNEIAAVMSGELQTQQQESSDGRAEG